MILKSFIALTLCGFLSACAHDATLHIEYCKGESLPSERIFLQQLSFNSVIIKWRGEANAVCFGRDKIQLMGGGGIVRAQKKEGEHKEAQLSGLKPDTTYYYTLGGIDKIAEPLSFRTAPLPNTLPSSGKIRLWILGDSGTGSDSAKAVRDGFLKFNQQQSISGILMLGDNAYPAGSDGQYQQALFDIYGSVLSSTPLWPAIGNHEMGLGKGEWNGKIYEMGGMSTSANANSWKEKPSDAPRRSPYLDIFSLPTQGELGGAPSGTELYYSLNYGNLHIVSLDSQVSTRNKATLAAMKQWLDDDLCCHSMDWTIVIFHHPPYSKGHHDSDKNDLPLDAPIFIMREQFVPIFERHGVDIVYSGHSHAYERSFYIKKHMGLSSTFDAKVHTALNIRGESKTGKREQKYQKAVVVGGENKVVYTVVGSSGSAAPGALNHPAHYISRSLLGSVLLGVTATQLHSQFIDTEGVVQDEFYIIR